MAINPDRPLLEKIRSLPLECCYCKSKGLVNKGECVYKTQIKMQCMKCGKEMITDKEYLHDVIKNKWNEYLST